MVDIRIRVDDAEVMAALRATRREIRNDVKRTFDDAARTKTLPVARRLAPSFARVSMTTKGTTAGAWLGTTARGKNRARIALLNWGGVVRVPIVPKRRKALHFGNRFAAKVTTPRRYKGKHFMEKAVELSLPAFTRDVEDNLARIIQSRINYASTFGGRA